MKSEPDREEEEEEIYWEDDEELSVSLSLCLRVLGIECRDREDIPRYSSSFPSGRGPLKGPLGLMYLYWAFD